MALQQCLPSDSSLSFVDSHTPDSHASSLYDLPPPLPPHTLMSFFSGRRRLAWRTGLPPSATSGAAALPLIKEYTHDDGSDAMTLSNTNDHVAVPDERLLYDMRDFMQSTTWANHDMLLMRASALAEQENPMSSSVHVAPHSPSGYQPRQKQPRGIFVKSITPSDTPQELVHIHADGSSHMLLSVADATTAIERGWAENDAMTTAMLAIAKTPTLLSPGASLSPTSTLSSLSSMSQPLGYVAVHAPRNATELVEWKRLVLASVRYGTYPWAVAAGLEIRRPERL